MKTLIDRFCIPAVLFTPLDKYLTCYTQKKLKKWHKVAQIYGASCLALPNTAGRGLFQATLSCSTWQRTSQSWRAARTGLPRAPPPPPPPLPPEARRARESGEWPMIKNQLHLTRCFGTGEGESAEEHGSVVRDMRSSAVLVLVWYGDGLCSHVLVFQSISILLRSKNMSLFVNIYLHGGDPFFAVSLHRRLILSDTDWLMHWRRVCNDRRYQIPSVAVSLGDDGILRQLSWCTRSTFDQLLLFAYVTFSRH